VTANKSIFDARLWKITAVATIQIGSLLLVTLFVIHFFLGQSALGQFVTAAAAPLATGLIIKRVMDKLRQPPPLKSTTKP